PNLWNVAPQDRWDGYQAQRDRILSFIDTRQIGGVLWVAGDFHLAFISKVSTSGPGATQREVLVGPGGQTTNPLFTTLFAPQFQYTTGTNNMTTLRFDPGARTVTVTYVNGDGDEFHSESIAL
ncbi:MAG: alkaline phosphatase D family protein, partial [Myxococcales bacterium]|nr:alkaline phosphatase D family protein [Myxococcales bacterium]